jgi:hypothetical protein
MSTKHHCQTIALVLSGKSKKIKVPENGEIDMKN